MKLMKNLLPGLTWLFLALPLQAQIKPTAMLLPIYFVDLDKKGLQGSLNNHVQTELSAYYELKSEKEIEQARDAAIDKLSSENCTEDACVKVMGEMLDVEYTFSLEVIDTGEGWDLTAVRQDLDGVSSRRNELCKNCSLSKARKSLSGMLTALRPGEMLIQRGKASLRLEATPQAQVFLDGRDQGKTPLDLSVDARKPLEVFMVAESYNDFAEIFVLKPGEKRKKHAKLIRKRGNIRITSNPAGATIYIDGKLELDSQSKAVLTPADLRLVYGDHKLKLQLKKYEDSSDTLTINKKNLGIKIYTLKPKPGRLIVRVPAVHTQARILLEGNYFGKMNGNIVKNFEVTANVSHTLSAEEGSFKSETKTVRIEPDGSAKVEFEDFVDSSPKKKPVIPFVWPAISLDGITKNLEWTGDKQSVMLLGQSSSVRLGYNTTREIELNYFLLPGIGFQWKRLRFEFYQGPGSIEINNVDTTFYYSDGSTIQEVIATSATINKIFYASKLPDGFSVNHWIWSFGYEDVELTLATKLDGNRTIKMSQPVIDGGYQWNWTETFYNLKFGWPIRQSSTNYSYVGGLSMGLGYVW